MDSKCLTEAEIAAYVDGLSDDAARDRVETHIAGCALCLRSVAELKQLADAHQAAPVRTPETALARAADIVARAAQPAPQLSIVAALHQGLLKILETTGSLLPPPRLAPLQVRKKEDAKLLPRVARSISGYLVTVELGEEGGSFTAEVTIIEEASSESADSVKVKLHSTAASETRYTRSGRVKFTSLEKGLSDLDIEGIGRISLEIR